MYRPDLDVSNCSSETAHGISPRIVLVGNTGWSLVRYRSELIAALVERDWKVAVIGDFREEHLRHIRNLGARAIQVSVDAAGVNPVRDLLYFRRLQKVMRMERPDVVHVFTLKPLVFGTLAAKSAGVPAIITTVTGAGIFSSERKKWLRPLLRVLMHAALVGRPMVIFQNSDDLSAFVRAGIAKGSRSMCIAGSGVDTKSLTPDTAFPIEARTQFVMASRMLWSKGVSDFVAAARLVKRQFPNASFVLFGGTREAYGSKNPDFIDRSWLEQVNDEGIVTWRGWTDPNDVELAMRRAAAVVLPSWYAEGIPRSLIEAASAGVPIITTNMPGCREVVADQVSGFLCPIKEPGRLANAMSELLRNPMHIAVMGQNSRLLAVNKFDSSIIIRQTLAVYDRALAEARGHTMPSSSAGERDAQTPNTRVM